MYTNFVIWSAENNITTQTAQLFQSIVKSAQRSKYLLKSEVFWSMSKICLNNEMPWILLPSNIKKLIIKCLIICLSSSSGSENAEDKSATLTNFFNTILTPLSQRFDAIFEKQNLHVESVIKEVMSLIETFNGVIEGTTVGLIKSLFPFIQPRLEQSVRLLGIFNKSF